MMFPEHSLVHLGDWTKTGNGWLALDLMGQAGKLNDAHEAWTELGALERAYIAAAGAAAQGQSPVSGVWPPTPWNVIQAAPRPSSPPPWPVFPPSVEHAVQAAQRTYAAALAKLCHDHMHHKPSLTHALTSAVSAAGHLVGDVKGLIGKVPGLSAVIGVVLNAIPGAASVESALTAIGNVGGMVSQASQVVNQAVAALPAAAKNGFLLATGAMTQAGITPHQLAAIAKNIPGGAQGLLGFHTGLALATARVTNPPPSGMTPAQQAGFLVTHGAQMQSPDIRGALTAAMARNAATASGASTAHAQIAAKMTLWQHVKKALGIAT